jgi:hypothetical protein
MRILLRAVFPLGLSLVLSACSHQTSSTARVEPKPATVTPANELAPGRGESAPAGTPQGVDRSKIPLAKRSPVVHPLRPARSIDELKSIPTYQFNETDLDAYLKYLHASEPDPMKRLVHLARKNLGQPYDIYLLGEYPYELYDPDPMYCLDKSDCVTNVEHMYAEALSDGWPKFFTVLQRLRYKDGKVGMLTRNHETVADWTKNNAWAFDDVTNQVAGGKQYTAPLTMTWRPSKFFAKFGIGQNLPDVPVHDTYIPAARVADTLSSFQTGDIIEIVRGDPDTEQWVGHMGLIVPGQEGQPHLLHSTEPQVKEQPLLDYVQHSKTKTLGIKVLRPKPNLQQLADQAVK